MSCLQLSVGARRCSRDRVGVSGGVSDAQPADRVAARIFNCESARATKGLISVVRAVSITNVSESRGSRAAIVDANV